MFEVNVPSILSVPFSDLTYLFINAVGDGTEIHASGLNATKATIIDIIRLTSPPASIINNIEYLLIFIDKIFVLEMSFKMIPPIPENRLTMIPEKIIILLAFSSRLSLFLKV